MTRKTIEVKIEKTENKRYPWRRTTVAIVNEVFQVISCNYATEQGARAGLVK